MGRRGAGGNDGGGRIDWAGVAAGCVGDWRGWWGRGGRGLG